MAPSVAAVLSVAVAPSVARTWRVCRSDRCGIGTKTSVWIYQEGGVAVGSGGSGGIVGSGGTICCGGAVGSGGTAEWYRSGSGAVGSSNTVGSGGTVGSSGTGGAVGSGGTVGSSGTICCGGTVGSSSTVGTGGGGAWGSAPILRVRFRSIGSEASVLKIERNASFAIFCAKDWQCRR